MIVVTIDTRRVERLMKNLSIEFPKAGELIPRDIARYTSKSLLDSARLANIKPFRGTMEKSLIEQFFNPEKKGKDKYQVTLPVSAIYLDSMNPHWVSLRKTQFPNQWLRIWAMQHFGAEGHALSKIFVRPHPFIDNAIAQSVKAIPIIAKQGIDKAMEKSRR